VFVVKGASRDKRLVHQYEQRIGVIRSEMRRNTSAWQYGRCGAPLAHATPHPTHSDAPSAAQRRRRLVVVQRRGHAPDVEPVDAHEVVGVGGVEGQVVRDRDGGSTG